MQLGETWAYREKAHTAGWPVLPVEILQFGPRRSQKVRIKFLAGEYPGLDQWVPKVRLRVPWVDVDDWLRDEQLYAAAREASHEEPIMTPQRWAAWLICLGYAGPGDFYVTYPNEREPIIEIEDPATLADALGANVAELLTEPGAFLDRHGTYVAPWPAALRIVKRIAALYPDDILKHVAEDERTLQREAVHGRHFQYSRNQPGFVPPEACAEWLRERQPGFALVREWCGAAVSERFDEVGALRAEVKRLRALVERAAARLREFNHPHIAQQILEDLDSK